MKKSMSKLLEFTMVFAEGFRLSILHFFQPRVISTKNDNMCDSFSDDIVLDIERDTIILPKFLLL